jgi:hypothetical protein
LDPRELLKLITREWLRLIERLVSTTSFTVRAQFILTRMFTRMSRRISRLEDWLDRVKWELYYSRLLLNKFFWR